MGAVAVSRSTARTCALSHPLLLAHRGWSGVSEEIRREHRVDLHQALAYASLADVAQVDTLLLYPSMGSEQRRQDTVAAVTSGRRRVRLILASVPFGNRGPEHEETDLAAQDSLYRTLAPTNVTEELAQKIVRSTGLSQT